MRRKYLKHLFLSLYIMTVVCTGAFASDTEQEIPLDPNTGFPVILNKPFIVFNEGITGSWITRIVRQTDRSNFVFKDFMAGAYFSLETKNMQPVDSMVRFAVYYPLSFKFNGHPQVPKNMLNFAFDLFAAPVFLQMDMWNYLRFNITAGLHFLYQMGDRWNYINLGIGALAGMELPVARRWTMLINGYMSIDYGNFGTNRHLEPYDLVWQYQLDIGVRYSRRALNQYSYIPSRRTYEEDLAALAAKDQAKQEKKEAKRAAKEAARNAKENSSATSADMVPETGQDDRKVPATDQPPADTGTGTAPDSSPAPATNQETSAGQNPDSGTVQSDTGIQVPLNPTLIF